MDEEILWPLVACLLVLLLGVVCAWRTARSARRQAWKAWDRALEACDQAMQAEAAARKCCEAAQRARTLMQQAQVVSAASPAKPQRRPGW
jgi:hypothetical protein